MPDRPGIMTSRTNRSGGDWTNTSHASRPSPTHVTSKPARTSLNSTRSRMSGSSSATRTRRRRVSGCTLPSSGTVVGRTGLRQRRKPTRREVVCFTRLGPNGSGAPVRTADASSAGRRRTSARCASSVPASTVAGVRYGAVIPWASEREFAELAAVAEEAGWDMVFSWESVWGQDAWVTLAAAATATEHLRLGTLLTPASRYRPWDLASRVASVDRLSGGRVTLGVGLGALHGNWLAFEPDEGRATRAARLDEGLAVYA